MGSHAECHTRYDLVYTVMKECFLMPINNSAESGPSVWPPQPKPQADEIHPIFGKRRTKLKYNQLMAFINSFLINIVLLLVLLIVEIHMQEKFFRTYVILGRHDIDRRILRTVDFCLWEAVLVSNIIIAYLMRQSMSYTRAFLIWSAIFLSISFCCIWSIPSQVK